MRVYIEPTPQKNVMKFVCDEVIVKGSYEFDRESDNITISPLVEKLMQFPFTEKVFLTANFVAVQKSENIEWDLIANDIKELVNEYLKLNQIIRQEAKKEPFSLYAEMTPNPHVMKFVANQILSDKVIEANRNSDLSSVPLSKTIFTEFPFLSEIFIQDNFISTTKNNENIQWQDVALEIRSFILSYLQNGGIVVEESYIAPEKKAEQVINVENFSQTEKEIQKILDEYIKPAVANDGGNISLIEFDQNSRTAKMLLQGACSGCPSSTATLKNGIEAILKQMLPGVVDDVIAVNG